MRAAEGPLLVPSPVLGEIGYLLQSRVGLHAQVTFLKSFGGNGTAGFRRARRTSVAGDQPPQRGPRHTSMHHPNVTEPQFLVELLRRAQPGDDKILVMPSFVLAQILGGGQSSRFYQSLVVKQKLATSVDVDYDGTTSAASWKSTPRLRPMSRCHNLKRL